MYNVSDVEENFVIATPKASRAPAPKTPKTPRVGKEEAKTAPTPSTTTTKASKKFAFDKIYLPSQGQREVFQDVEPYVNAAVMGYNATIFAYGYC